MRLLLSTFNTLQAINLMVQQNFVILIVYTSKHIDFLRRGYQCRGTAVPKILNDAFMTCLVKNTYKLLKYK